MEKLASYVLLIFASLCFAIEARNVWHRGARALLLGLSLVLALCVGVLAFAGCGQPPEVAYRIHGARVYLDHGVGPSRGEMLVATDAWLGAMAEAGAIEHVGEARAHMAHLDVHWLEDGTLPTWRGYQRAHEIRVEWKGCCANTAIHHEIWHYLRQRIHGVPPDYDHESPTWGVAESALRGSAAEEVWCR